MNHLISDNRLSTIRYHFRHELKDEYAQRELENLEALILSDVCGLARYQLLSEPSQHLTESQLIRIRQIIKRLKKGEPVQYILGFVSFCGFRLELNANVLIPRPETEELIMMVRDEHRDDALRITDAGCGSGCIAVSLAKFLPQSEITAVDIDENALNCTRHNAKLNDVNLRVLEMNIIDELPECDILVSNPPYISPAESSQMSPRVLNYEPHIALFSSTEDPILYYRKMLEHLPPSCKECYFEINEFAQHSLTALMNEMGISSYRFVQDMQGKMRFLHIRT